MKDDWQVPEDLYYDENDFWIKVEGDEAVIGLTDFGQNNTGDILFIELPAAGAELERGEKLGSIESGKWVGKLFIPLSGKVLQINDRVENTPHRINFDAYGDGWLYRLKIKNAEEIKQLMQPEAYRRRIKEQARQEQELEVQL